MPARIYKPSKTAMQSGQANTKAWVLDFELEQPRRVEPLMGWTSSGDMRQQLRLRFEHQERGYCLLRAGGDPLSSLRSQLRLKDAQYLTRTIFPSGAATPGPTDSGSSHRAQKNSSLGA